MSTPAETPPDFFIAGGALKPGAQSYVHRPADDDLFNHVLAGEFCYVLMPRQMGKTSLMVRTVQRLESQGVRSVVIDLTSIGTNVTPEQWYLSILTQIARQFRLAVNVPGWWKQRDDLSYVQRLIDFLREQVLAAVAGRVVIFVDEIDTTLSLPFRDDFFAGIRALYNARPFEPDYERLSFVLLGVASPADLIKDNTRTPFNIGYGIALGGLNQEESGVLRDGLEAVHPGQGERIFRRIFYWTNGHPYLTQKLCLAIAEADGEDSGSPWNNEQIDRCVFNLFLAEDARKESNLKFVQERLLNHPRKKELLRIYRRVASGKRVSENGQSPLQNELKLSGIVAAQNGILQVRNRIYQKAFNLGWVRRNLPVPWGTIATVTSIVLFILLLGLVANAVYLLPAQANEATAKFYSDTSAPNRVHQLARLFSIHGLLIPVSYRDEAVDMFYRLSAEERLALFPVEENALPGVIKKQVCPDRLAAARGIYRTMADIGPGGSSSGYLANMRASLKQCRDLETGYLDEYGNLAAIIDIWLTARSAAAHGNYPIALEQYTEALGMNGDPNNQAARYELAQVQDKSGNYKEALDNLEAILSGVAASAPAMGTPTGEGGATPAKAETKTFTLTPDTPSGAVQLPAGTPEVALPGNNHASSPPPAHPAQPFTGFTSESDEINAVRSLMNSATLQAYIAVNPLTGYQNLRKFGFLPDLSSQRTAAAQAVQSYATLSTQLTTVPSTPSITVQDQPIHNGAVVVPEVVANGDSWLVIHNTNSDGTIGTYIGYTHVPRGVSKNVVVRLDLSRTTQVLMAWLHIDAGKVGTWEFPGPDVPMMLNVAPLAADFRVVGSLFGDLSLQAVVDSQGVPLLADGLGLSLYMNMNDTPGGTNCTGNCLNNFKPVHASDKINAQVGVSISKVGVITRPDGILQVTYAGKPLYFFIGDQNPGDTKGKGIDGVWNLVAP